ncbi:MAG: thioredoxin [Gemmatimonadota bacterium]
MTATTRKVTVRCPSCGKLNRVDLNKLAQGPKCGGCGKPLPLDRPLHTTTADFDQTISSAEVPVLVDFYADWCGPCHMMAPTLDALAKDKKGQVLVLKVDTEKDPALATRFDIRGLPTVVVFKDGKEFGRQVGVAARPVLERLLGL